MAYLLDTMVLSELTKKHPDRAVLASIEQMASAEGFVGTPSLAEIEAGVQLLDQGQKRHDLELWLRALIDDFGQRILAFDIASARAYGIALARAKRRGMSLPIVDAQLAAIALTNDLTIVTRNTKHLRSDIFEGLRTLNPWT